MVRNILRVIFILLFSFNIGFAKDDEGATKADIKVLIELIKSNQENTNKRFDNVNRRFEDMQSLMFALLASIFGLIGYSIYDRKKVIKDSKDEFEKIVEERLIIKADKKALDKVVSIIEELAKVDKKVETILNSHNIFFKG